MKKQQVAIIGAGIIGLTTAFELQRKGVSVTIFDGKGIGQGASFGNAGHFATEQVFPLADPALLMQLPKMLLDPVGPFKIRLNYLGKVIPWFCRFLWAMRAKERYKNIAAIRVLNEMAIPQWRTLLQQINSEHLMTLKGSLLVYENKNNQQQMVADYQYYRSQGVKLELLSAKQTLAKEPNLSPDLAGALYFSDVAHTPSPKLLCEAVFQAFIKLGGHFIQAKITDIHPDLSTVTINSHQQNYPFDKVVVCAGAHAKALTASLGHKVPLESERGYHLMLPNLEQLQRPVASYDRKFIMTPMQDGLRLAGIVEFSGMDNTPNYHCSDMLLSHAKALLPSLSGISLGELSEQARRSGLRPSLPDSRPVIDVSNHDNRVYFNFGHQHLGLTWAAVSAKLLGELLTGSQPTISLEPYRINRF